MRLGPFQNVPHDQRRRTMAVTIVIGTQWGDEGKATPKMPTLLSGSRVVPTRGTRLK